MKYTKRVIVRLTKAQNEALRKRVEESKMSASDILRKALMEHLQEDESNGQIS